MANRVAWQMRFSCRELRFLRQRLEQQLGRE